MIYKSLILLCLFTFAVPCRAVDLSGQLAQGGMVWGKAETGAEVLLDGKPVKVGPEGHFVFGFAYDAAPSARLVIKHRNGTRSEKKLAIAQRTFAVERVDGLPPKTVTMPPEWTERRKVENGRVASARAFNLETTDWLTGFSRPAEGRYSGFYGSQRILNGIPKTPHYGLDIAAPVGKPVYAPAGGTVRLAAPDFLLEGGIIILDHGYGVTSTLFHLNSVEVKEGATVQKGDLIGTIGEKGRASGPHVDWRVNWGDVRLDPWLLLSETDKNNK